VSEKLSNWLLALLIAAAALALRDFLDDGCFSLPDLQDVCGGQAQISIILFTIAFGLIPLAYIIKNIIFHRRK
jgi:hypothetical protein